MFRITLIIGNWYRYIDIYVVFC